MEDCMAEHLDHFHYLNDIICLGIKELNQVRLILHLVPSCDAELPSFV